MITTQENINIPFNQLCESGHESWKESIFVIVNLMVSLIFSLWSTANHCTQMDEHLEPIPFLLTVFFAGSPEKLQCLSISQTQKKSDTNPSCTTAPNHQMCFCVIKSWFLQICCQDCQMDFCVIIFICSFLLPFGTQPAPDGCTDKTTSFCSAVKMYVNVCHTHTLKTNKCKLHSASSILLPVPLQEACAHRRADGGESARFLLLCLCGTVGIKGPFYF